MTKLKRKKKILYLIIGFLLFVSILLNTYLILKYKVLPMKYLYVYILIVVIIPFLMILYTLLKKRKSKIKGIILAIEIIYIIVLFLVFFYLNSTFNFLDNFTKDLGYETKQYNVLVLKDNAYKDIKDIKDKKLGYTKGLDTSVDEALKELNKKIQLEEDELEGYGEGFKNLDDKNIDAFLITNSYYETLIENDENDSYEKYTILYKFFVKEKSKQVIKEVDVTSEPFNVYITGIDTYGAINEKTRSDVNIVMSVNPQTNKILLINIPRDYYVELSDSGVKDKLTHAGVHGIDVSVKTIENLLDTEINYYVKVNYNALIKLVDALGGVDVESEYDFTSGALYIHYNKGLNHVDGKSALEFVRTRKAFLQGDRVRGENQQRMIQAIFKKAISPSILIKYDNVLKSLEGNFLTNFSTNNIISLINMQLDKMPSWEFNTYSLNGGDDYIYTSSEQKMYVMIPNSESVKKGTELLKNNIDKSVK